jgi:D-alanine-D-alanine ligase-like ATP-grasp enzyme
MVRDCSPGSGFTMNGLATAPSSSSARDKSTHLIAEVNQQRSSNMVSRYLSPITLDSALKSTLAAQAFTLDVVLKADRTIPRRRNANRSTGGTCFDETGLAHKDVRAMAEALACATGIDSLGIDYLTKDIGKPPKEGGGAIVEFNKSPGLE